jgi:hypothetical protein
MTVPNLQDERLAWLAVRDDLRNASTTARGLRLMRFARGINCWSRSGYYAAESVRDDIIEKQMIKYAIAADELVATFSVEERFMLRATGRVPAWYLDAILDAAKRVRI